MAASGNENKTVKSRRPAVPGPDSPVTSLSGVGPARAAAYEKLGVKTVRDLIYHIPRAYENRGDVRTLDEARTDGRTAVVLTVSSVPVTARLRGRMTVTKFRAADDSGVCELVFFNQPYLRDTFVMDSVWRFYGTVERRGTRSGVRYRMTSPSYERCSAESSARLPDFVSVYPLTEGLSQKQIAANVEEALRVSAAAVPDVLPDDIRTANRLCTLSFALKNIHVPDDYAALAAAKRRLCFDELFLFSLLMAEKSGRRREPGAFPCTRQNITPLLELLPYTLTEAQKSAVRDIAADMRTDIPMNRIVIGDVGCGKTAVAAAAIYIAVLSGRQAALMAPTEILATQHFESLSPLFSKLGVSVALLTGSTSAAAKRQIKERLGSAGEDRLDVVIGTHALLTENTGFSSLALVVTDEQHRFGVAQRAALAEKAGGTKTHVLTMSATPIPRSLALVLYGDLDISRIEEMPAGRRKVETLAVTESSRPLVDSLIRATADEGGQVYIVCPSIDEPQDSMSDTADGGEVTLSDITDAGIKKRPPLKAAKVYAEKLREKFPDLTVALIHGRMKGAEKEAVMTGFAAGDIDVLVSTTVIEVGVNVPNATLMIVENAERFGLSQLHQLRGRVGRGEKKSRCVLVSEESAGAAGISGSTSGAGDRLEAMVRTDNGFEIAEADLKTRGPGDFLSRAGSRDIRQSGGLRFRFADLGGDAPLFAAASDSARRLIASDPGLDGHPELRDYLASLQTEGPSAG